MTDNDIIKALECCSFNDVDDCAVCPYCHKGNCIDKLMTDALELINFKKAEIERLNNNINAMCATLRNSARATRHEAIKEFAERLCEDRLSNDPVVIVVKCELKEMVGEDNA